MKRAAWLLLSSLLLVPGCVSVEGPALVKGEVQPGQRTILLVFAAPTPVMSAEESNVATAADIIPGIGLAVQSFRDDRNVALSKDLGQNLPSSWNPAAEFTPILMAQLQGVGNPGRWVLPADTEIIPARLSGWNQADNVADWTVRYYGIGPIPPSAPRNYAMVPGISDALIFEADLSWGLKADSENNETPVMSVRGRLVSAATNKLLWSKEETVEDSGFKGSLETLKPNGQTLAEHWKGLMPRLAAVLAEDFRKNLVSAGLYSGPSLSTATVSAAPPAGSAYSLTPSTGSAYSLTPAAPPPQAASNPNGLSSHP